MLRLCSLFILWLTPRGHNSTPHVSNGPLTQPLMLAESSHAPDIKAPTHFSHPPISDQTIQDHQWHCSKRGSGVTVHLNSAAMDSRMKFVLLWMLLSFTCTRIKLDGNGYVDIVIAISSKVPQDDMLVDKIKVNYYYYYYYCLIFWSV